MLNDVFMEMWFALTCGKYIPQVLIIHCIILWRLPHSKSSATDSLSVVAASPFSESGHLQYSCHQSFLTCSMYKTSCQARLRSKLDHAMSYLAYISTYSSKLSHLNGRKRDRRRVEASYISCAEPCLRAFPPSLFCTLSACWLPDAQCCDQIIHVRNFGSLMKIACCAHATLLFVRTFI